MFRLIAGKLSSRQRGLGFDSWPIQFLFSHEISRSIFPVSALLSVTKQSILSRVCYTWPLIELRSRHLCISINETKSMTLCPIILNIPKLHYWTLNSRKFGGNVAAIEDVISLIGYAWVNSVCKY